MVENLDPEISVDGIKSDDDLLSVGINSVSFIKVVVGIEEEFQFEFDESALNVKNLGSIQALINYINSKV
jgi:acyl carrier protein